MTIVFYSTSTNTFDSSVVEYTNLPQNICQFADFKSRHPQDTFYIVTQKPALFMPEADCTVASDDAGPQEIAETIASYKADLAIAMTFWVAPFDWLTVSDALVAEKLKEKGICTVCNPLEAALICFDKNRTREFFEANGFSTPRSLFVDHDMFFCAGSHKEVLRNAYRESVFAQVKKMKLPLVIKDTTGLSSYSLAVVNTYGEATAYLTSRKNNSNRIIQEFEDGIQAGIEIYGVPGNYTVLAPFVFSVNKYGITSPKQSVKYSDGSVWTKSKEFSELKKEMLRLAELLKLEGAAQVDLVLKDGKWKIIEINPRLSGMSLSYTSGYKTSIFDIMYSSINKSFEQEKMNPVLSIKFPPQDKAILQRISELNNHHKEQEDAKILHITQIYDSAAKQEREKGWCEVIISGKDKKSIGLLLGELKSLFSQLEPMLSESQKPDASIFEQSELMLKYPLYQESPAQS